MNHDHWEELGSRYRDGDLDRAELAQFEEHLQQCDECRESDLADALLADNLRSMFDDRYPGDLESRTMLRIQEEREIVLSGDRSAAKQKGLSGAGQWFRYGRFTIPVPVALAAAIMLIFLGAAILRIAIPAEFQRGGDTFLVESSADESEWIEIGAAETELRSLLIRTRTLLLALTTARPDESGLYHLEAEESLSRDLIQEVRVLESSDYLDERTDILSLIRDLEVILLDVSTWQGEADDNRLAMLRGGITDRSLIYRLATWEPINGVD
jgi:hypothetical protein